MKTKKYLWAAPALIALTAVACNDSSDTPQPETSALSTLLLTASYELTSGTVNYILKADDLTRGSITSSGEGKESVTGTYWVYCDEDYLFRLNYNQGSAGVSASYELNADGNVADRDGTYEIKRFTSYGRYDDYLITTSTGALNASNAETVSGNSYIPRGFLINNIDVKNEVIGSNTTEIWSENYLNNGEFVTFAGWEQVGTRLFTAPIPMGMSHYGVVMSSGDVIYPDLVKTESGGSGSGAYTAGELQWTQHPNEAWVAIYNGMDFTKPAHLIRTDKISYAAGRQASQYYQMVWAADNGDVYIFSPSHAKTMSDSRQQTTLPAGVVRIKADTNVFDADYYCNIEAQSNGCAFLRSWHIGGDYFLLMMYDRAYGAEGTRVANKLAVYKGESKTLTYVTGLPEAIASFGNGPYFEENTAYVPIVETGQHPAVWVIDAATANAVKGVSVEGASAITSVGKLTYKE